MTTPPGAGVATAVVALALVVLPAAATFAQTTRPATQPAAPANRATPQQAVPGPVVEPPPPPYEKEMLRLSEIMGSLAFLRTLCAAQDGAEWRNRMTALIDAEATTPTRKEKFAGAYNRGFRGFATTYRACTPSANAAIERYLAEGRNLSRAIAGRFGG